MLMSFKFKSHLLSFPSHQVKSPGTEQLFFLSRTCLLANGLTSGAFCPVIFLSKSFSKLIGSLFKGTDNFFLTFDSFIRYFVAPTDKQQDEEKELLGRIIDEAYTTHLWNRLTASVVPENGSVIETLLNRYCLHCTDIL